MIIEVPVALVDDHHMMRSGIAATLASLGGYHVAIEAGNGRELIDALDGMPEPRIAIVDLSMPVMDGYATIAWLREHRPAILPLAFTYTADDEAMVRAVRVGARGFLLKTATPEVLKTALDSIMATGYYYSDELYGRIRRNPDMRTREERERERIMQRITPREMQFLLLVCDPAEFTYEQIAARMEVQRSTLDGFRIGLFEKFSIKSKTGLVLFALRWGLVPLN